MSSHHGVMSPAVVVGFDGSASARTAARYGAAEALRRGVRLELRHAFSWPRIYPPLGAEHELSDPGPRARMRNLLADTTRELQGDNPGLDVAATVVDGSPGGVLVDASRTATLL